jgi:hypothetical protein
MAYPNSDDLATVDRLLDEHARDEHPASNRVPGCPICADLLELRAELAVPGAAELAVALAGLSRAARARGRRRR